MKRNFKLIAAVLVLAVMALTLASCEYIEGTVGDIKDSVGNVIDKIVPHEHEFSADWSSDETNHWHAAICDKKDECASATADLAAHTFADGVCSVCGYKAEEEAPHEHVFVDGKCECGETDPNYVPPCTEHAYSITVTKEATCTEDGEKTLTCTVCGHSETQTVAPLGHEEKTIEGTAPTCTDTGLSKGKVCSVCGETLTAQSEIPALGHSFVEGACSVCGEVDPNYNGPKTYVFVTNTVVIYNEDGTQNLTDKAELPTDVTYCDGYFSIIGSVVQRIKNNAVYCVELNKQDQGGVQFTVTGTATVSILFHSTSGDNTSWFGVRDADGNLVDNNEGLNTVTGTGEGLTVTYNLTAGTYTVVSPALTNEEGKDPYNRAVRLYSISVTETPAEEEPKNELKVTTTDTYGYNDLYSFTADAEGYYTFNVPAGLGFYSKAKYDLYKDAEVDYYYNENGATAVIGLKAGETLEFYIGAMTKGDWLITWSFEAGEVIPEVEVCNHWWMPAMGHEQMVLPTCQTGGVIVSECWNCGEFKFEEVGPDTVDGHDYVTNSETFVEVTCTTDGYKEETCSLCGDVKETTFDHETYGMHDYIVDEETYKEANCMEAGYAKYTCSVCGDSYEETPEADPAWGHKDVYYADYSIMVCEVCNRVQIGVYVEATETSYGIQFGMNYGSGAIFFAAFNADNSVFEMYGYTVTLADGVYTVTLDNMNEYETSAYGLLNATITVKPACGGVDVTITSAEGEAVTLKNYEGDGVHAYTYPCDKICSVCYEETNPDATHTIVHVEAKAATCTENGNVEYWYCSDCGYAWADEKLTQQTNQMNVVVPTVDHDYVYGICSACQAKDPAYVDYYLVGYINGADYGCEADYANLGEYKFVDGKLTVTFNADSYVFVKTGNLNGESVKWYLFETYHDAPVTEGTLIENKSEKMFIPGNVEVVFTLVVNEDGTLTLSYHLHSYEAVVTEPTCTNAGYTTHTCSCGASYTDSDVAALGHDYVDGICSVCSSEDPNHYFVVSNAEAVTKADGKKVQVTGVVISAEAWNTQYNNMSVTIKDANGDSLYIFRLATQVGLGDTITVKGVVGSYNGDKQIAAGATAVIDVVHGDNHTYADGVCTVCGTKEPVAGETTTKCDFSTVSGTQYADETKTFGDVTVSTHNKGCHFNTQLRIYDSSSNNGWAIITAGKTITGFKVNAGNNAATLNVYGSVDGETWTLIEGVVTTKSYADHTVNVDAAAGYKFIKIDAVGAQIRVASVELSYQD